MYYFHELSSIEQTKDEKGNYKDIIKPYGCGHSNTRNKNDTDPQKPVGRCWCVPECPFFPETGRVNLDENGKYVVTRI